MRYSVDAICRYKSHDKTENDKYVLVKRLNFPSGLAFPGGGIENGEDRERAILREVEEETGIRLRIISWIPKVYNQDGRDPRFPATSYVAYGEGSGALRSEEGKTEVILLSQEEILERKDDFVFDHFEMFLDYLGL